MIEGIESYFQQIADAIVARIPEEWATAKVEAVFFPQSSSYAGEYARATDGVARNLLMDTSDTRVFRELRNLFKESGQPLWGRACFELTADGEFNMKWDYDDCDEDGNAIFDEEVELKRAEERHRRLTSGR